MNKKQLLSLMVLITVILVVCAYYVGQNSGRKLQARCDSIRAHNASVGSCIELGEEVATRMLIAGRVKSMSIADFEKQFGSLVSTNSAEKQPDSPKDATHFYMCPKSYRTFYLCFKEGVLFEIGSGHCPDDITPYLPSLEERLNQMI